MPIFRYAAKDKIGKIHRGQFEADNEKMVELKLQEGGFQLIEISPKPSRKVPNNPRSNFIGNQEVILESSMETHGEKQAPSNVNPVPKLLQIVIATAVALIGIALWIFAR